MKRILAAVAFCAAIPTVGFSQTPKEGPHPWCTSLNVAVPNDDVYAKQLAKEFMTELDNFFDLKGYAIRHEIAGSITQGISENNIDFAVVPSDKLDLNERGEVLWNCCDFDKVLPVTRHGWKATVDTTALLRRAQAKGTKLDYVIVASPKVFEMGYKYRANIFNAAEGSVIRMTE